MPLSRREFLGSTMSVALLPLISQAADPPQPRPNILLILADDLGYGDLGCFGHPFIKTPNLDALAAAGVKFTDCYSSAPVCSPSRCGLLTGRIPHRLGIDDWIPQGSPIHLRREEITIAQLLKKAGYATCHSGKWHCNGKFNNPNQQPQPGDAGFDHWFSTQNNAGPSHHNPVNFVRNGKRVGPLQGYSSEIIVDEAITWLKSLSTAPGQTTKPFCLFIWFHATHEPVATAEEFVNLYPNTDPPEKAVYYGNVSQLDHAVGRLMKSLADLKLADNTLTFFTSDNGPEGLKRYEKATFSHGSTGGLRGSKLHLYEGGLRVPGILHWPGHSPANAKISEPIINLDLLPTFCAAAGAEPPKNRTIDGANILPLLASQPLNRQTPLYWQYNIALGGPKIAMRDGDYKLLAREDFAGLELYNLYSDPKEKENLVERDPQRREQMLGNIQRLHDQIKSQEPQWPPQPPARLKAKPDP
jgi:arylsulfatase A